MPEDTDVYKRQDKRQTGAIYGDMLQDPLWYRGMLDQNRQPDRRNGKTVMNAADPRFGGSE